MVETFCTGEDCTHKQKCERFLQKEKAKNVAWWIKSADCIEYEVVGDVFIKLPYSEMVLIKDKE